ncbi:hypothetical protein, partial [Acinetobacter baumannii]|uniref:hypothetical protein n=1 Tax=Acinetobacter baumannii TaxID=470 RepID=UPI000B2D7FDD
TNPVRFKFKIGSKIDKSIFKLEESEENIEYKALVGFDDWVSWFEEEEEEEEGEEVEEIDLGEHYNPFDK